jgi:hypothetical protein
MTSPKKPVETLAPQRNFTLTTEDRVRAVAAGPPAFIRRLRAMEDLEEGIVRVLVERCEEALALQRELTPESRAEPAGTLAALAAHAREGAPVHALERLNDLVDRHNRYYPVEANLAMHPRSGALIDRTGQPWEPMAPRTLEELITRAIVRVRDRSSLPGAATLAELQPGRH